MKENFTAHAFVLLVLTVFGGAHVASGSKEVESSLDRQHSVCLELRRFGLSAPGCDVAGSKAEVAGDLMATPPIVALQVLKKLRKVCPVLCDNQVTSSYPELCNCDELPVTKVAMDVDAVCNAFCEVSVSLNGCSCVAINEVVNDRKLRSLIRSQIIIPVGAIHYDGSGDGTGVLVDSTTTTTTTEPDWDSLCASLCKVGEGGALCNCDKPPFV